LIWSPVRCLPALTFKLAQHSRCCVCPVHSHLQWCHPADTECLRVLHANKEDCRPAAAVMQGSTVRCAVANVGHAGGINCLDLSPDGRFLVAVGLNSHSKQLIILWNVTGLIDGQKVTQHRRLLPDSSLAFLSDNLLYCIQD